MKNITDILSKTILIILIFILLVFAPLMFLYTSQDLTVKKMVLNEMSLFIDKVTVKGTITPADLDDLYLGINSHGGTFDADVYKYIRIAAIGASGTVESKYYAEAVTGATEVALDAGDIVKVEVKALTQTKGEKLLSVILRFYERETEFSLAGAVS